MTTAGEERLREVLRTVRLLKKAQQHHALDGRETLAEKVVRWQRITAPDLPLVVRDHDPAWPTLFEEAQRELDTSVLEPGSGVIEHIGSSAVPGLAAKPFIDLAVAVDTAWPPSARQIEAFARSGYRSYGQSPVAPDVFWFWKVTDRHAWVVHLCQRSDPWLQDAVDVRDYLRAHPTARRRYATEKRRLLALAPRGGMQYSLGKIVQVLELSKQAALWKEGQIKTKGTQAKGAT